MILVAFICFAILVAAWLLAPGIGTSATAPATGTNALPDLPPAGARA